MGLSLGIPGLIRKYYGIAQDGKSIVGIYQWKSKREADAFYTTHWAEMLRSVGGLRQQSRSGLRRWWWRAREGSY